MDRWVGKVAVVSGASAGIGLAVAKALVTEGMIVVGLARRKEKMENEFKQLANAKGKFYAIKCDVTKEKEVIEAFEWTKKNLGPVQVLVNNAGYAIPGAFSEMSSEVMANIVSTNFLGYVLCTKQALLQMHETKLQSHIINMNSIAGHRVRRVLNVNLNVYPATKHAITGMTETLRREIKGSNIRVTSISPGLTKTEIHTIHNHPAGTQEEPIILSEDVADAVVYALGTPQRVEVTELTLLPHNERAL